MKPQQDFLLRGWKTAAWVLVVLLVVSLIPPVTVGGVTLRRANIFSDLYAFDDPVAVQETAEVILFDEAEFAVDFEEVNRQIEADTTPHEVQVSYEWLLAEEPTAREPFTLDSRRYSSRLTPIEDFSDEGRFAAFCDTLLYADRPVRIAVLGDSFIEGDILTADLRERLQTAFGGRGTGFAPMASPLTAYRRTIKTQSKGWTAYNVMQHKSVPAPLNEHFYVSGWVCRPVTGASTRWEATTYRKKLDSCSTARVLFIAPEESRIELVVNDSLRREFAVEGASAVRQAVVHAPQIQTLEFRVLEGAGSMIVYGALFDSALDQTAKAIEDVVAGKVDSSQLKYELSSYRSYRYQSVRKQRQPADMRLIYQGGNGQMMAIHFGSRHMPSDVYSRLLQRIVGSL